jgi:hypothetical protein
MTRLSSAPLTDRSLTTCAATGDRAHAPRQSALPVDRSVRMTPASTRSPGRRPAMLRSTRRTRPRPSQGTRSRRERSLGDQDPAGDDDDLPHQQRGLLSAGEQRRRFRHPRTRHRQLLRLRARGLGACGHRLSLGHVKFTLSAGKPKQVSASTGGAFRSARRFRLFLWLSAGSRSARGRPCCGNGGSGFRAPFPPPRDSTASLTACSISASPLAPSLPTSALSSLWPSQGWNPSHSRPGGSWFAKALERMWTVRSSPTDSTSTARCKFVPCRNPCRFSAREVGSPCDGTT